MTFSPSAFTFLRKVCLECLSISCLTASCSVDRTGRGRDNRTRTRWVDQSAGKASGQRSSAWPRSSPPSCRTGSFITRCHEFHPLLGYQRAPRSATTSVAPNTATTSSSRPTGQSSNRWDRPTWYRARTKSTRSTGNCMNRAKTACSSPSPRRTRRRGACNARCCAWSPGSSSRFPTWRGTAIRRRTGARSWPAMAQPSPSPSRLPARFAGCWAKIFRCWRCRRRSGRTSPRSASKANGIRSSPARPCNSRAASSTAACWAFPPTASSHRSGKRPRTRSSRSSRDARRARARTGP